MFPYIIKEKKRKGDVQVMDIKLSEKLKVRYDLKNRNDVDSTEEFLEIINEYQKNNPQITDSELAAYIARIP